MAVVKFCMAKPRRTWLAFEIIPRNHDIIAVISGRPFSDGTLKIKLKPFLVPTPHVNGRMIGPPRSTSVKRNNRLHVNR
jgi:hypothetical protein